MAAGLIEAVKVLLGTRSGREITVRSVCAFTGTDGRPQLASGGNHRTVRVWDPVTGVHIQTIPVQHEADAITHNGELLIIGLSAGLLAIKVEQVVRQ